MTEPFEAAVMAAASTLGPVRLRRLAGHVAAGELVTARAADGEDGDVATAVSRVIDALGAGVELPEGAAFLRGVAAGFDHRATQLRAEVVWTGPGSFDVPVRSTAQVLTGLIEDATRELILTTYSAKHYPSLIEALAVAVRRGVDIWIVVETLRGAGSALQGDQPAKAFLDLAGVDLWTWAIDRRPEGAKMHAKLAVADRQTLFATSANLTTSGIDNNIEAGVLVRGGSAPQRAAEHLWALRRDGTLIRV